MESLFNFIGFVLEILGLIERRQFDRKRFERLEKSEEDSLEELSFGVYEYGAISGFVGNIFGLLFLILIVFIFGVGADNQSQGSGGPMFCCLQLLSLPVGAVFGVIGKSSSKFIRDKFDFWYISFQDFSKICVVGFGFLGGFFLNFLLFIFGILLTT